MNNTLYKPEKLLLERYIHNQGETIGKIVDPAKSRTFVCYTIERPSFGDHPRIPEGLYKVQMRISPKLETKYRLKGFSEADAELKARVWELQNVPGRACVQIHVANKANELRGCIAPGLSVNSTRDAVLSSILAFSKLKDYVGGWDQVWWLEVKNI